jgi:hypothetical protein
MLFDRPAVQIQTSKEVTVVGDLSCLFRGSLFISRASIACQSSSQRLLGVLICESACVLTIKQALLVQMYYLFLLPNLDGCGRPADQVSV